MATFFANGTGTIVGRTVSITHTDEAGILGGGTSTDFQEAFNYSIGPGNSITIESNTITGTELTGPRAGQTFTLSNVELVGHLAMDGHAITAATAVPNVETLVFSVAPQAQFRLCHRSRVFIK